MLNETYRAMLNNKSVIRETFMYGRQRAAQIGSENVFDYSLGNPSVPCPPGTARKCTQRRQVPGSTAYVPAVAGLIIAGEVINDLAGKQPEMVQN